MLSETLCASLRQIAAARRPWRHSPRTERKTQEKVRKEICAHSENAGLSKRPLHEKKKKIYGDTNLERSTPHIRCAVPGAPWRAFNIACYCCCCCCCCCGARAHSSSRVALAYTQLLPNNAKDAKNLEHPSIFQSRCRQRAHLRDASVGVPDHG